MKKAFYCALGASLMLFASLAGCTPDETPDPSGGPDPDKLATVIPTVYDNEEVKNVEDTQAGNIDDWAAEVFTKSGGNNDNPTKNALIHSPWHKLTVNGVDVPVYTARCGKGPHSFAWVDVVDHQDDFNLDVTLELSRTVAQCVVLPQNKNVEAKIEEKKIKSVVATYGSFTYTFSTKADAVATDPTLMPITLMVTKEEKLEIPPTCDVQYIEPGYHGEFDLEFTGTEMYYVFKPGLHEICSINVPEKSVLWLERGAYLKCADRESENGGYNRQTAIHMQDCYNPQVRGRGLLDMGETLGGDNKYKHVVNATRCDEPVLDGLTVINSNTWTVCFYNDTNAKIEHNLLLGYRTYSDGLMMSECRDSVGRYNFVRTGDDGIEFKGTGWGGQVTAENCVYEYNDCWSDKGCCYGIIWESTCDMTNMVFRNNNVGFAQPTWSNGNNALDCRLGTNVETRWGDVTFKDFEIYHVISPNVLMTQMSGQGAILENILFENINVHSTEGGVYAYTMMLGARGEIKDIKIKNYTFCGKLLTAADKENAAIINFSGAAKENAGELTLS